MSDKNSEGEEIYIDEEGESVSSKPENSVVEDPSSHDTTTQDKAEISLDTSQSANDDQEDECIQKENEPTVANDENKPRICDKIYQILNMKENIDIKYGLLIGLIKVEQIDNKDVVDSVLHLLVNGAFDMEQNFMIHSSQCVVRMLEVIGIVNPLLKAELLSVFIGILRKSKCNLKMTINTNIIETTLEMLNGSNDLIEQLLIDLLGIVAQFNVSVKELRSIMHKLKAVNGVWPPHSIQLLKVLQQMPSRNGPDEFFNFPGSVGSGLAIPPISKWPYQNGWTFNCWIQLDPASASNVERDTPFLYCFRTNKGFGYSAHFVGNNLVITTMKMKDKGLQHCIKYNFQPRKWYMVTVVYVYNRWSKSEIRCYIDGQLMSQFEMSWQVNTSENFDRCFIGISPDQRIESLLTGQISCIYGFVESLNPHQIGAIFSLGPSYKGNFKFEAESPHQMSDSHRKAAFEGRLSQTLMFSYNPIACDRQLCLNQAPKNLVSVFAHSSHALMMGDVQPVLTRSVYNALHSVGGIKILYPLFGQIDCLYENKDGSISDHPVPGIGARLLELLLELLCGSASVRQQLVQSRGLLLVSHYLSSSSQLGVQLNLELFTSIMRVCRALSGLHTEHMAIRRYRMSGTPSDQLVASMGSGPRFQSAPVGGANSATLSVANSNANNVSAGTSGYNAAANGHNQYYSYFNSSHSLELIKHIYDYLLSNTALWIFADPEVQVTLYEYLSEEFLTEGVVFNKTRCINAVLQCLYAIKYYYWLVDSKDRSGIISKVPENAPKLSVEHKTKIRTSILMFIKKMMLKCHNGVLEEELQGMLNFLTVVNEDDNLRQILYFCVTLMYEQPSTMVPAFDRKLGVRTVFKLLGSPDETIRIMSLKLLGYYLQRSTFKRKQESMGAHNLFSLIGERILIYQPYLTTSVYNTLYEILTEKMTQTITSSPHPIPEKTHRLENPLLLKVIAHLIRQSHVTKELIQVHKMFLSDLNYLCNNSRDNRRTVLQMSVWQDWLLMLAPLTPKSQDQQIMLDAVLNLVKTLLHHAIKVEFGGWRVWIDTLAILHSKVAYNDFCRDMRKFYHHHQHQSYQQNNQGMIREEDIGDYYHNNNDDNNAPNDDENNTIDLAESVAKTIVDNIVDNVCDTTEESTAVSPMDLQSSLPSNNRIKDNVNYNKTHKTNSAHQSSSFSPTNGPRSGPFRIPEFIWSPLHQKLLHDLLLAIECDLQIWERSNNRAILDFVNSTENQIYVVNLIHLVTMLSDNLITCCGGLLPLLAAATSPSGDVDLLENGQGMKMCRSISFLLRIINIADIVVFASNISFTELEQEKTMSTGGILRQCLRLVCTCAVRNCLENRFRELHCQMFNDILQEESQSNDEFTSQVNLPPDPLQELIKGLRPRSGDGRLDEMLFQNYPITDPQVLLQEMDINRLRAVIYRDVEEAKQAQFLALAIVYFLSVLMVSRYRDLLEPPPYDTYSYASSEGRIVSGDNMEHGEDVEKCNDNEEEEDNEENDEEEEEEEEELDKEVNVDEGDDAYEDDDGGNDDLYARGDISIESDGRRSRISGKVSISSSQKSVEMNNSTLAADGKMSRLGISAIEVNQSSSKSPSVENDNTRLPEFPQHRVDNIRELSDSGSNSSNTNKRQNTKISNTSYAGTSVDTSNLTKRMEQALGGSAPLIREIFFDFSTYLSRTLIGSHGQELVSSGLISLKQSTSVVEMVMLLCSQEWQNSLQKHAGLAFIELVNEGRLLAHASRDHIVRVANEAHFIVSRVRAEDVQRHGEFSRQSALTRQERQAEDRLAEQLISGARARDSELAVRLRERARQLVFGRGLGVWASGQDKDQSINDEFYRLDSWEDDSRRRKRLVPNPYGSKHEEAVLSNLTLRDSPATEKVSEPVKEDDEEVRRANLNEQMKKLSKSLVSDPSEGGNISGHGVTDEELMNTEEDEEEDDDDSVRREDKQNTVGKPQHQHSEESHVELDHLEFDIDVMTECSVSARQSEAGDNKDNIDKSRQYSSATSSTANNVGVASGTHKSSSSAAASSGNGTTAMSNTDEMTKQKSHNLPIANMKPLAVEINGPIIMSSSAKLLAPGVTVHGVLSVTKTEFYFEMDSAHKDNIGLDKKVLCYMQHLHGKWHFSEIRAIFSRKFLHRNVAIEIFVANRTSVMFALPDQATVRQLVYCLPRVGIGIKYGVPQHRKSSLASPRQLFRLSSMTRRWQQREVSNFDYLMYLNTVAGRTYNDLNQYHIFPWILANYDGVEESGNGEGSSASGSENKKIDLTSPANYRDLSLPIGALNPSRRHFFQERYHSWDDDSQPPFHFGTHYSTAAFVLNYMIRLEPFTTLFLNLQSGKFDHADRIFHSIPQTWKNCQRDTSDVKELIPEFFYLPEMFINRNQYKFGSSDDGLAVDHVRLPSWAKTPEEFIRINRQALESEFVSCQLHHWIDLIFGYKQRGPEAVRATNVFCYLTYEGSVNWNEIKDPMLKQALEDQIRSFGQTPSQLLTEPHPPRNSALHVSPLMFTPVQQDLLMVMKFLSNSPIVWLSANVHHANPLPAILTVSSSYYYGVHKWNSTAADNCRRPVAASQTSMSSLTPNLPLTGQNPVLPGSTNQITPNSRRTSYHSSVNSSGDVSSTETMRSVSLDTQNSSSTTNFVSSSVQLPLMADPVLNNTTQMNRRGLGEGFDLSIRSHNQQFTCTPDNKVLFAGGFWDNSFRIYSMETGRLIQVVYGHFGVVTCLSRSESSFNQDCYVVTGSNDCTIMLWLWGHKQQALLGDFNCRETAQPRMTITGHQAPIVCVQISGELGLVVSASKESRCLIHSLQGELLQSINIQSLNMDINRLLVSRESYLIIVVAPSTLLLYNINGRKLNELENNSGGNITSIVLSRDSEYILVASDNGSIIVRRCWDLSLVHEFPRCDAPVCSIALTTDQRFIIAALNNGCLVVFNIDFYKWHHEFRDRYPAL